MTAWWLVPLAAFLGIWLGFCVCLLLVRNDRKHSDVDLVGRKINGK